MTLLIAGIASAQISQRGTSTDATNNGGNLVINKPTGVVANDLMIAVIAQSNDNSNAMSNSSRAGWTLLNGGLYATSGTDNWYLTILYRVADATDSGSASYSFTNAALIDDAAGAITAFSGVDITNPFDVLSTSATGSSNSITAPSLTSVTNNALIMMIGAYTARGGVGPWSATSPSTLNEVFDIRDNATVDQGVAAAIGTKTTAGATGNGIASIGSALPWTATMIALRPVTVSTGTITGSTLCAGSTYTVPYTLSGPFSSTNDLTAQLSNAAGSFASPTTIGTLTDVNTSGNISVTIPASTTLGSGYRIRVIASSPSAVGTDNGADLTISTITANAGTAVSACESASNINITAGASASGQTSVLWTSNGTGSFTDADSLTAATYTPSAADIAAGSVTLTLTASGDCPSVVSNKTLTINSLPIASAGGSSTICSNQTATVSGATASNGTILWTENGSGSITAGATTLTPTYTPAAGDIGVPVTLTMTVSNPSCPPATATYTVNVNGQATAVAGTAVTTCSNSGAVNITAGSSATNNSGITWTSSGTGTFSDANSLTLATYTPSAADISAGSVTLTLTATGNTPCGNAVSNKVLTISAEAVANAGPDASMCSSTANIQMAGSRSGTGVTSSTWSTSGTGTFNNSNLNTQYNPSAADRAAGSVTITLTTNDPTGPCGAASDTMVLTIFPAAIAVAGANQTVCAGGTINISGTINGGASSGVWSAPSGVFGDVNSLATTYTPSISSGTVVLTLSTNDPAGPCGVVTSTLTVTVNALPTLSGVSQAAVCENTNATIALSGMLANSTSNVSYTVNGGSTNTVNGVVADASGNASFAIPVTAANNGQTLTVSSILRTDLALDCASMPMANNSVVLQVNSNVTYYADTDNDGFGNPSVTSVSCFGAPEGFVSDNTDCDDADDTKHASFEFYLDNDGDTYGAGTAVSVCAVDANTPPSAEYVLNNTDCDDANASVHQSFDFYTDADGDGFGSDVVASLCAVDANTPPSADYVTNSDDCDDTRNTVYPNAVEIGYNQIDDDCDGSIDEGFPPKVTQVQSTYCAGTLPSINSQIMANIVSGAQGYRWRVTTMTGPNAGEIQHLDTALRVMKITQLANYAFDTQYQVVVAVYYNGTLQQYTNACTVTTPVATTQLSICNNATLPMMSTPFYANLVPFAAGYRFRITDPENALYTQQIERPLRDFRMTLVTSFPVYYGKTYNVEVSVKNTDGTYMPYGSACTVTTPIFPVTSLIDEQCEDFIVTDNNTQIYAYSYPGAIGYGFLLKGPGLPEDGVEVIKPLRSFRLSDFDGAGIIPGATYNVQVRLIFNLDEPAGPHTKVCTIVAPGLARAVSEKEMVASAVAYPNPFANTFAIEFGNVANDINVKIYDMTGRLLESKELKADQLQTATFGEGYPSGVYNVVMSNAGQTQTLRVIKR